MAGKSNKAKMTEAVGIQESPKTITEAAKRYKRISFSIEVEEKILDGKKVVTGKINSYDLPSEKPKKEFTDMDALETEAGKMIKEFFAAIKKSGK